MTCDVLTFDPREGGSFRISLTYKTPTGTGKTTAHTDTYRGRFVKLVPHEQVVEVDEFDRTSEIDIERQSWSRAGTDPPV